jgi:putative tryptophan/tyrosine transport system substrate-binding protein
MKRREFITLLGATVAWPIAARAQQPTVPVVGFVNFASAEGYAPQVSAFLKGLSEAGYVVGRNVAIEYRWAEGRTDQLPAMVADLVHRQVAATGVTNTNVELAPKRLQLLHELVPTARVIALLINPANPTIAETNTKAIQAAAPSFGLELHVLNASTERDFDGVFAKLTQLRAGGLVIGPDPFFTSQREQLAALALRHAVPTIYQTRGFAAAGGLLSYGADVADAYRLTGNYTGRVLKGEKPADLPVQQATKVEMYINLKTAKALGINVPNTLIGRADEVIE